MLFLVWSSCFNAAHLFAMRFLRLPTWIVGLVLILALGGITACQTLREVSALKDVRFRIERASDAQLAGISLDRVQSYNDLGGMDLTRLGASLADGTLPFSFTLHVQATNPEGNSINARLTKMDWTLLLEDRETISGTFDREVVLPPGEPTGVSVGVQLDLVEFFDNNLRQLVGLASAVGGEGPPTNVKLKVQPTIQTRLGPMRYPSPITVVSEDVGASP
jgi:hypothetical protein